MLPPHQPARRKKIANDKPGRAGKPRKDDGAIQQTPVVRPTVKILGRPDMQSPMAATRLKRGSTC